MLHLTNAKYIAYYIERIKEMSFCHFVFDSMLAWQFDKVLMNKILGLYQQ